MLAMEEGMRLIFYQNFIFTEVKVYSSPNVVEHPLYGTIASAINHAFTVFVKDFVLYDYERLYKPYTFITDLNFEYIPLLQKQNLNAYSHDITFSTKAMVLRRVNDKPIKEYYGRLFSNFFMTLDINGIRKFKVMITFEKEFVGTITGLYNDVATHHPPKRDLQTQTSVNPNDSPFAFDFFGELFD